MTYLSCLTDQDVALVLDSSVVINLLATGHSGAILRALAIPLVVTTNVVRELELGAVNGRPEFEMLKTAISDQTVKVEELSGETQKDFFDLVSGSTSETLGDGEAATLAFAYNSGLSAVIDEKKATRIATERYGTLRLVTTVDILAHKPVQASLGGALLAEAAFQALCRARMQVREHQFDWVARLIGPTNVDACPSLKRHARRKSVVAP